MDLNGKGEMMDIYDYEKGNVIVECKNCLKGLKVKNAEPGRLRGAMSRHLVICKRTPV
jgi:hypothetical protein